jgi:CheY-like chemotaxis protein
MTPSLRSAFLQMSGHGLLPAGGDSGRLDAAPGTGRVASVPATGARLLIVEDDWFIGIEIESVSEGAGYEVVDIVTTAEEAIEAALAHRPELVLMDIRLAGPRDGVEAAIEIRQRADIPSLFVSAHQDAGVRARAEAARPAGWLSKPFSDSQLLGAIRDALASASRS